MNLLNLTPKEFCKTTAPCAEGRDFALRHATMAEVWDACPRADWMMWIADKLGQRPDDRTLRLFAVWCVRHTPLGDGRVTGDLLTDPRSLAALKVAERHAHGQATDAELSAAYAAAYAAFDDSYADAAHRAAAAAATHATEVSATYATYAAFAAYAAAAADARYDLRIRAAADAYATYAATDASAVRRAQADQFRCVVPNPFPR